MDVLNQDMNPTPGAPTPSGDPNMPAGVPQAPEAPMAPPAAPEAPMAPPAAPAPGQDGMTPPPATPAQ